LITALFAVRFSISEEKLAWVDLELYSLLRTPFVGVNMWRFDSSLDQGYAYLSQTGSVLHMRQRSRALIVVDASNSSNRFVLINAGRSVVPSLL
jgi:hypothetical protein